MVAGFSEKCDDGNLTSLDGCSACTDVNNQDSAKVDHQLLYSLAPATSLDLVSDTGLRPTPILGNRICHYVESQVGLGSRRPTQSGRHYQRSLVLATKGSLPAAARL